MSGLQRHDPAQCPDGGCQILALIARAGAAEAKVAAVERALDDEEANLADDGARLSHAVVRRLRAVLSGGSDQPELERDADASTNAAPELDLPTEEAYDISPGAFVNAPVTDVRHNHITRDVKKYGTCPACDAIRSDMVQNQSEFRAAERSTEVEEGPL